MEQCGFFNANLVGEEYDRVYLAEQFASYFASFINNGIFAAHADRLQVVAMAAPQMQVAVSSGQGWINGYWYENTDELYLPIEVADGILHRVDSIVLRWGSTERTMWLAVKKGTPVLSNPVAPPVVRNADYYELQLATVSIPAGALNVTQARITDTRSNNDLCGWVTGVIDQINTTNLFAQYDDAFNEWFETIVGLLEGDVAANLLNNIETHKANNAVHVTSEDRTYWNSKAAASHTHAPADITAPIPISGGGHGSTTAAGARSALGITPANIGAATRAQYTATVSTSWSGSGPYTQNVTVSGLLATDSPIVGPVLSATLETRQAQQEAWNMVSRITTSNNTLSLTCDEDKPTVAIPIQIMAVR